MSTVPLVFCPRGPEECDGIAEPEEDGEVQFYKCVKCGFESGYRVISQEPDGSCQLGIPEDVRRAHLMVSDTTLPSDTNIPSPPVFLGPTITRRAE